MTAAAPSALARTVLVVDDEQVVRLVVRRFMQRSGWIVAEAESAEQALALLDGVVMPDLVICDLNLPGLSGAELCLRITERQPALASRLVLTSGDPGSASRQLERAALGCPVLGKPFSLVELERMVESVACSI
jgi:CheY-like chemotaxis protein